MKSGGSEFDVIPAYVEFGGTLRSLTTDGMNLLIKRLKEVCTRGFETTFEYSMQRKNRNLVSNILWILISSFP